jgi:hypothetical protein
MPTSLPTRILRAPCAAALVLIAAGTTLHAQAAAPTPKHTPVCSRGVRVYMDRAQVPAPHDTLTMPPADGPIRVTSPEEAEAAELALRGRAGSVGANAVLIADETTEDGGEVRIRRSVTALFVPSDSARAIAVCTPK